MSNLEIMPPREAVSGPSRLTQDNRAESLYDRHRDKVWEDIKSGTENFDRNLLVLSSGALVLSVGLLRDVVPLTQAIWMPCLFLSWSAFALCILTTLASFQVSIRAQEASLPYLKEVYLEGKQEAFDKHLQSGWSRAVDWCTYVASTCFIVGLISTLLFVGTNVLEVRRMSNEKRSFTSDGLKPMAMTPLEKALKPAGMTPVSEGLKPMGMTPLPAEQSGVQSVPAGPAEPAAPAQPASSADRK